MSTHTAPYRGENMSRYDHEKAQPINDGYGMKYSYSFDVYNAEGGYFAHSDVYSPCLMTDTEIAESVKADHPKAAKVNVYRKYNKAYYGGNGAVNNYVSDIYTLQEGSRWETVPHIYTVSIPQPTATKKARSVTTWQNGNEPSRRRAARLRLHFKRLQLLNLYNTEKARPYNWLNTVWYYSKKQAAVVGCELLKAGEFGARDTASQIAARPQPKLCDYTPYDVREVNTSRPYTEVFEKMLNSGFVFYTHIVPMAIEVGRAFYRTIFVNDTLQRYVDIGWSLGSLFGIPLAPKPTARTIAARKRISHDRQWRTALKAGNQAALQTLAALHINGAAIKKARA